MGFRKCLPMPRFERMPAIVYGESLPAIHHEMSLITL